ncbi:MAG: DUF503 domain-containing protein [Myxococcota bacterium]|nr:DUF503 domain-containing protein [Myxococcota bacterium]MDW8363003.1 DUF503 domain-containing protein [Myxococcales bacterium]
MVVGYARIGFVLPGNDSLKGKRAVVRRLLDRARARFPVAAAEVGALDVHQRAVVGFAVVSNDGGHAREVLDRLGAFVESEVDVIDRRVELLRVEEP